MTNDPLLSFCRERLTTSERIFQRHICHEPRDTFVTNSCAPVSPTLDHVERIFQRDVLVPRSLAPSPSRELLRLYTSVVL